MAKHWTHNLKVLVLGPIVGKDDIEGSNVKTEQKKPTHFLDMIAQQILILELKMIKQGQNKISRALI